jgi:hypothetical protein
VYELNHLTIIQVERLSIVINLCGIMGQKRLVVKVHGPFLSCELRKHKHSVIC